MKNRATFAAFLALLAGGSSHADFVWDGDGGDDLMDNDFNWVGDLAPGPDVGGETFIFGPAGIGTLTPDVGANDFTDLGGISFEAGALGSYLIGDPGALGGSFSFTADTGFIENTSSFLQTIDVDLVGNGTGLALRALTANLSVGGAIDLSDTGGVLLTVDGGASTTLGGVVSGVGGAILKTGSGSLFLNANNTFDGGVELQEGTIVLGDNGALGTGTLHVTGDGALQSSLDTVNVNEGVLIDDNVTLTVSGLSDLRLTGTITGGGALTVDMGAATKILTLNGANDYAGGTTLNSGTVIVGNNLTFGTGDVSVTGDFTLQSNLDDRRFQNNIDIATLTTLTFTGESIVQQFGGVISGDGALGIDLATDDDSITLRGVNTYTGGTTLTQGTIVLANNDALGEGTLTLAGDGSIESSIDSRVIDNDIDNGGFTLTFSGTNDLRYTGILDGAGGLTLDAAASLTVTGNNTMTGLTQINTGAELIFENGTLRGSVDINDGGTLTGVGRVLGATSDLSLRMGGVLTPGSSIGTIEVGRNYLQETGGTYVVELDADTGLSDLLDVSGTATLDAGAVVEATVLGDGYLATGQTFTVIDADLGVTDNGAVLMTDLDSATIDLVRAPLLPGGTEWALEVTRAADAYAAAATPGNNTSIGTGLDGTVAIADADPMGAAAQLLGQLDALDSATYNQAVTELSPEPFHVTNVTGVENIREFTLEQVTYLAAHRDGLEIPPMPVPGPPPGSMALAADDPLILAAAIAQADDAGTAQAAQAKKDPRWGRFFKVQGVSADQDTTADRTGFDANAFGAQIGVDYAYTPEFVLGVALGYTYTDADLRLGLGNIQGQTVRAGPYMSLYKDKWYVDGSATFGWTWYNSDRNNPTLGLSTHADYTGWDVTGYVGSGYRFDIIENLSITPIGSLLYSHFDYDGFTETGGGGMALTVPSRDSDSFRSRLGANLAYRVPGLKFRPVPYLYAGWEHEFLDDDNIEAAFATGGSPFLINVGNREKDAFFVGGGFNILVNRNVSAFLRVEGLTASNSSRVGAAAGVSVAF